jgi:cytochrome c biogenesis protein CcmG/thiol:disulfide interchange protein DsbE
MADPAPPAADPTQPPRRWLVLLPLAVFLGLAGLFYYRLVSGTNTSDVPSALIGKPVPAFSLPPLQGLTIAGQPAAGLATADLAGRVTVVNVWASWCVPCRQEHPLLAALATDTRIRLVGINYKDDPENALRFLGQLGNPFAAVGTDRQGRTAIDWGVYGVPESFVVGRDGRIAYKYIGPLDAEGLAARLKPEIEKALAAP